MAPSTIDSKDTYRELLAAALSRAQEVLRASDDLEPRLILAGPNTAITIDGMVPAAALAEIVQHLIKRHPAVNVVFRVQLGRVLISEHQVADDDDLRVNPDAKLCVVVHAAHRDLGFLAVHQALVRRAEKQFDFDEELVWVEGHCSDPVLADPWASASRHLNS